MNQKGWLLLVLSVFLFVGCLTRPDTDKSSLGDRRIVGYFPVSAIESNQYDPGLEYLSHINLWFFNLDEKGEISAPGVTPSQVRRFVNKAQKKRVRVFISVGGGHVHGGTAEGQRYLKLFREGRHQQLIDALLQYADKMGLDGIDLDFEGDMLIPEYNDFVVAMGKAIKDKPYQLSGAFGLWGSKKMKDAAITAFDFLNLMIYNESGLFDKNLKDHSSYTHVEKTLDYWKRERGIHQSKLVVGVPFYGWQRTLDKEGRVIQEGSITYRDVFKGYPEKAIKKDFLSIPKGDGVVTKMTYNSLRLIRKKSHLAANYGGVMIWHIAQDTSDLKLLKGIYTEMIN